ncbi:hypothetical protein BEWA_035030 [Theileria equi strain WA]|uniref:Uncharacterized protein n=1 Tax=Theileria equi strain WA TaxID=1537102 RepID=L1LDD9_THEEQ|nr:hypothetical protein BEWA_035030 [Theileria equi strain WA]EKX73467.1 hypothetical protein BEWA_035030 [Theileria equi strain WA]|eukprot:XP_004832919.1 hypothetical protein BEWA_035030 [Theileria equi strain WA]
MEGAEQRRIFSPLGQSFFPSIGCCTKPVESPINIPVLNPTYYGHQIFLEPSGMMPHQKFVFAAPTGRVNVGFAPQYPVSPQVAPAATAVYGQVPQEPFRIQSNMFDVQHQDTFGLARLFDSMSIGSQVQQSQGFRGRFFSCCAPKEVDANEVDATELFNAEGHEVGIDTPRRKPFCNFLRKCYPQASSQNVSRQPSIIVSKEVSIDEQKASEFVEQEVLEGSPEQQCQQEHAYQSGQVGCSGEQGQYGQGEQEQQFQEQSARLHDREVTRGQFGQQDVHHLESTMFGNLYATESMVSVPGFENVDPSIFQANGNSYVPSCWTCYPQQSAARAPETFRTTSSYSAQSGAGCFSGCMGAVRDKFDANFRSQSTFGLRDLYRSMSSQFLKGVQSQTSGFFSQQSMESQKSFGQQQQPCSRLVSIAQPEKQCYTHRSQVQPNTFKLHAIEIHQYVPISNMPPSKFVQDTNPENFGRLNTYNGLSGDQQWIFNPHTTGPVAPMMSNVINRVCKFKVPEMYELRENGMIERLQTDGA